MVAAALALPGPAPAEKPPPDYETKVLPMSVMRLAVLICTFLAATPAFGRHTRHDVLALVGGHKSPFVFLVAGLTARFTPRFLLGPCSPAMRMRR